MSAAASVAPSSAIAMFGVFMKSGRSQTHLWYQIWKLFDWRLFSRWTSHPRATRQSQPNWISRICRGHTFGLRNLVRAEKPLGNWRIIYYMREECRCRQAFHRPTPVLLGKKTKSAADSVQYASPRRGCQCDGMMADSSKSAVPPLSLEKYFVGLFW